MRIDNRAMRLLLLIVAALVFTGAAAQADEDEKASTSLADLMPATGLKFTVPKEVPDVWIVPFDTSNGGTLEVYVTYNDEGKAFALIFATLVDEKVSYTPSRELLLEAMKFNNDWPGVKLVYDAEHGDVDCQTEVYLKKGTVTPEVLADMINNLAARADEVQPKLQQLK